MKHKTAVKIVKLWRGVTKANPDQAWPATIRDTATAASAYFGRPVSKSDVEEAFLTVKRKRDKSKPKEQP